MKFGYGLLTAQNPPESARLGEDLYDEILHLAQVAENNGFDSVWTSEHHFFDDGYTSSVLPLSAALAAVTESVTIGTAIALGPLYDPLRLAEDVATVDRISGGRFVLGIANGYMQREFDAFDVPKSERARRVSELIEICRRSWSGEPFVYDGDVYSYDVPRVTPSPVGDGVPIYLGGTSKPAVGRAARKADGHIGAIFPRPTGDGAKSPDDLLSGFLEDIDYLESQRDLDTEFTVALLQFAHVEEEADAAWESLRPWIVYNRWNYAKYADDRDESQWNVETMRTSQLEALRSGSIVGDPESVISHLREYESKIPCELHLIVRLWNPFLSRAENAEAIRLFGSKVIPALS